MQKYFSFLMVFGLLLTACGKGGDGQNGPLVGSWQATDKSVAIKFGSDGKFTSVTNGKKEVGTYSADGSKLKITADGEKEATSVNYELASDVLKLLSDDKTKNFPLNKITDDAFAALLPK